jgi:hypothetical protein
VIPLWTNRKKHTAASKHVPVDQVLERLLAAALVGVDVALGEHVFFERGEVVLAGLDLGADAGVSTGVAVRDARGQFAVGADVGRENSDAIGPSPKRQPPVR